MSTQVSAVPVHPQNAKTGISIRRSADFHPSIWGDHFLSFATNSMETDEKTKPQVKELKEEVRRMVMVASDDKPSQKLRLIDAIQRLGVSYHFEAEIDEALQQMHKNYHDDIKDVDNKWDLYSLALHFRLLRQQGYHVSSDVFNKFKDSKGKFKESLASDVQGMMGLYEATHLRIHGEDVLDEAFAFTTAHLEALTSQLSPPLAAQVSHALKQHLHKGIQRLEARHYMSIYQEDPSHSELLLTFAKSDFNLLQKMHQKELSDFTRWWKDLDFKSKLPFARDRLVEGYFWTLALYHEPEYVLARGIVTKIIAMTSVIDDIYDAYGTIEELKLFTDAVERWDIAELNQLPEYMQVCYAALLDVYNKIEEEMASEGRSYRVSYAKEAMKALIRAYLQEAKWFNQQYTPTMEEYMSVALVTSVYSMLATASFVGMGDIVTKDAFEWLLGQPRMVRSSSIICRLMDDIASNKFEQNRGHVASSVQCYMKQYGATEQETVLEFRKQVSDAWKDINEECLHPTAVPMPLLTRILNFARVIDVAYKDGDGYTHAEIYLKDFVASLLVDHVPI